MGNSRRRRGRFVIRDAPSQLVRAWLRLGNVTSECPARKLSPPEPESGPDLERTERNGEPVWVVRSFELARQLLREPDGTRQAGFGADRMRRATNGMRPPILYLEGDQHRLQRRAAARFFAPAVIEGYRPMMESLADQLVSRLRADRPTDLTKLSMRMAVGVAGRVIGLTNSSTAAMSRRLAGFFGGDPLAEGRGPIATARMLLTGGRTARFYRADVRPAIRARRTTRQAGHHQPADRRRIHRPGDLYRVCDVRGRRDGHHPRADQYRRLAPD